MEVAACAPQNQEAVLKRSALSSEGDCGDDVGTCAYVLEKGWGSILITGVLLSQVQIPAQVHPQKSSQRHWSSLARGQLQMLLGRLDC